MAAKDAAAVAGFNLGPDTGSMAAAPSGVSAEVDVAGLTFDLNECEETSFEVLPKGTYDAIVEEFELTTSQSSGNPMIKLVFNITTGEFADRKIYDFIMLAGEGAKYSMPRLKQLILRACPDINAATFNAATVSESGTMINRQCRITLGIQTQKKGEYKGEKRNNVKEILAANSGSSFLG